MFVRCCLIAMLVIIPFCQANPFKQVARLLPSAKAAAESSAIRESAIEIGKMMLKDAKVQIRPPPGKKLFVAALCLLEIESKEAPESVEIEEQPAGEEVEVVDAPKQKKDSKGKKFLKSAKKAAVKVGKTTKKAAVKVGKTTKKAAVKGKEAVSKKMQERKEKKQSKEKAKKE
ncbi:hypothetical protein T07_1357 [Trichinella nelsoni]|uniref:Uncharacterized protein n=1 Tax=Trichinella nelsoni TaxID=6336 RepID=A0A0V0SE58_9BILA|nr:hypothetical protein T07_1357 [Trichinella nelsoni]